MLTVIIVSRNINDILADGHFKILTIVIVSRIINELSILQAFISKFKSFIPSRIINDILAGKHFKILTIFIVSRIINHFLAGGYFKF
jgi:hypothetical protein